MGGMTVCDKVCLGVVSISSLLPCDKSQSPLVDEGGSRAEGSGERRGLMTVEFLLENLSLGR